MHFTNKIGVAVILAFGWGSAIVSGRPCLVALAKDGEFVEDWGGVHDIEGPGEVTMEVAQYKFKIKLDGNCFPTVVNHIPHGHEVSVYGKALGGAPAVNYLISKGNKVVSLGDFDATSGPFAAWDHIAACPDLQKKKVVRPFNYFN
ncbi:hypothetical protein MCOR12_006014 [Pyricularia oryzae]|uniref:Uncharacterized protein n=1 Tax=Pyricularia grisea TaxID=148305 RepID=A0ABQ8NH70_PYRGI|nr:hypothetical protein MCOR33_007231 [Pyricularia grisea]KAI6596737.1 hypothetical protein MCOR12_006014 [Pyricularia oryzae]